MMNLCEFYIGGGEKLKLSTTCLPVQFQAEFALQCFLNHANTSIQLMVQRPGTHPSIKSLVDSGLNYARVFPIFRGNYPKMDDLYGKPYENGMIWGGTTVLGNIQLYLVTGSPDF